MKLIKEQVELLEFERQRLMDQRTKLIDSKEDFKPRVYNGQTTDIQYDVIREISNMSRRIAEIDMTLETSEVVENPNTRYVQVGSVVNAFVRFSEDDTELLKFTVIEKRVSVESSQDYISLDSDFGKAIENKNIGDVFYYDLPNGVAKGTITEFEFERKDIGKTNVRMPKED